jgi:hypothetical protein
LLAGYAHAAGGSPSKLEVTPVIDPNVAILRHDQTESMLNNYKSENSKEANVLDLTLIIAAKDLDRTQHDLRGVVSLTIPEATSGNVQFGFAFAPLPAYEINGKNSEA